MLTKDRLKEAVEGRGTIVVDVAGWSDSVRLRHPTFKEWHGIIGRLRGTEGKEPPAETIAYVIGVCLANDDGSRMLTDAEATELLDRDAAAVFNLYTRCWSTVLKADGVIEAAEKNC